MAKELTRRFKFHYARAAARPIAQLMSEALPFFARDTIIVHIPTATVRRRQRGFDQAELLARQLARSQHLLQAALLARQGQSRQVGATREQRLQQLINGFHPRKPYLIKGAHILLVDDVTTTGATLEAAAKVLKQAGAKRIDAVVFAQKL
jgi:ComF family protein